MTATWRVIEREGVERATIRNVARELGATTGVLLHYFADKDELFAALTERLLDLIEARAVAARKSQLTMDALAEMCLSILPGDPESQSMWRVWVALLPTKFRSRLAGKDSERYRLLRADFAQTVQDMQAQGQVKESIDPVATGTALLAFLDGLALNFVLTPEFDAEAQKAALMVFLDGIRA